MGQKFNEIKEEALSDLKKQYDQESKNLSKKYLNLKNDIIKYCQPHEKNIAQTAESYRLFKKLATP